MEHETVVSLAEIRARHEREKLTLAMLKHLEYLGLAQLFVTEYRFNTNRKWRLDLYAPDHKLGVELHGGTFRGGRHVTGVGFARDREKMNAALEAGIRVLEYTADWVKTGNAALQVERIIKQELRK